ncbi:MAG TPA: amidohydrolase family protein, partial [Candidatus Goldiibacteriota bacterium]|nr:amidohydrolase family protein [Candidatus Goldiibacteriota bacterium]
GDGTLAALKGYMENDGVALSINAPIATRPEQVISINRKMVEHNKIPSNVICFGTMHPLFGKSGNVEEELEYLAENGIKGIKMHTEYQEFYPDDGKLGRIYRACVKNGLIILFHAGADAAYDFESTHGTPKRFAAMLKAFPDLKAVLAHMGGFRMWDQVYREIAGKNVYFDTAYSSEMEDSVFKGLVAAHGAGRVVFGTDFPWERASVIIDKVKKNVENEADREKIFHLNAEKLLGL